MIVETVILLQCGGSSTNRGAGMADNIHIVHYLQSASNHFPCLISSHTDGFAHTTCVGQWNTSKCNLSKGLKIACVLWLALSCSSGKCCDYYHEKEPRLVFLTTRDVHESSLLPHRHPQPASKESHPGPYSPSWVTSWPQWSTKPSQTRTA